MPAVIAKKNIGKNFAEGSAHYLTRSSLTRIAETEGVADWRELFTVAADGAESHQFMKEQGLNRRIAKRAHKATRKKNQRGKDDPVL